MEFLIVGDDMDNEQLELLKEDLITIQMGRPTRLETERIVTRVTDAISDMAQDIATKILNEHYETFDHDYKEEY